MRRIKTIRDVVGWGLCVGCGACQYFCGKDSIALENIETVGIRPIFKKEQDVNYSECLKFCPGYSISGERNTTSPVIASADPLIGPTLEIWQGYASDKNIRYNASSGGAVSALATYCLEKENMEFVLHVGMDKDTPWYNKTVQSKSRADLLARAGSRYAPSSPCDSLALIESSSKPCVFIGKPCDVAAVSSLRKYRPKLDANLGLVLTFFCAGPPCTAGTLSLLQHLGVNKATANEIRYRGKGWPGNFQVTFNNRTEHKSLTYEESWKSLANHHRSFRCHLCPDGLGELADISCGDAWHLYDKQKDDFGRSLVLAHTERGSDIVHRAMESGYLQLEKSKTSDVIKAQPMTGRRAEIFGRLLAMKTLLMPVPQFAGFPLTKVWLNIPIKIKIKTYLGTLRRILTRGLWHKKPAVEIIRKNNSKQMLNYIKRIIKLVISLMVFIFDYLSGLFSSLQDKTNSTCVILYYHTVYTEGKNKFEIQMDDLLRWTIPIHVNALGQIKPVGRYSAVTFDDGFICVRDNALPVLAERKIPATIFIPSGCLGEHPPWLPKEAEGYIDIVMTATQLNSLDKKLVLIGSHCRTHQNLLEINRDEARKEIIQSKKELEDVLNTTIETISFPHGDFNQTHLDLAMQAGYRQAFSILPELNYSNSDEFVKGRVKVDPSDWRLEYRLKLLGAYRWLPKAFLMKTRYTRGAKALIMERHLTSEP